MSKVRVFVSSTMRDLANERDAVVRRLADFNFEPVNAEGWSPTGTNAWKRIEHELSRSQVFVLILGERYGYIPEGGPGSECGKSVTHLEYESAQKLGLPILPFLKTLDGNCDLTSDDAAKRGKFRNEVTNWDGGVVVQYFRLASDLANRVGEAVVTLLSDRFLEGRTSPKLSLIPPSSATLSSIPSELVTAVREKKAILFAGAGMSLYAGLPSASAFAQHLIQLIQKNDPTYTVNPVGSTFSSVAADFEASYGRLGLLEAVRSLLPSGSGLRSTPAHMQAVKLFDQIITTNYDDLFERALEQSNLRSSYISEELLGPSLPDRCLVKLHGSASNPDSLLLTELDTLTFERTRPRLWEAVKAALCSKSVVVTGASLRDPSIIQLVEEAGPRSGFFVAPHVWQSTPQRLRRWNLTCIDAEANSFMEELARLVAAGC